ncbi:hypothetical protein B0H19DRAFT_1275583 [Mycena capillaripes]|nr:hypothetical protein B0H19DRAFT_1275583 [Mycena capillaripes]
MRANKAWKLMPGETGRIPGFARELHVWSGGRQIEVRASFEIIVGVTMLDWAATADLLSDIDDFQSCLTTQFNLTDPTLLYRFSSGPNKPSVHHDATVTAGADMIKDVIAVVHRRIDANERDARACDADMKAHLVNTLTTVVTAAKELSQRQLDTSRATFIMQQENTLNLELARIDTDDYNARREYTYPINAAERRPGEDHGAQDPARRGCGQTRGSPRQCSAEIIHRFFSNLHDDNGVLRTTRPQRRRGTSPSSTYTRSSNLSEEGPRLDSLSAHVDTWDTSLVSG